MRMIHAKLAAAMQTWRDVAAELKNQERLMGGAIRRMIMRKLSQAWETWQAKYYDTIAALEELARQDAAKRKAMLAWINRQLKMAWNTWREMYLEQKRQAFMMKGAIRRMIMRKL